LIALRTKGGDRRRRPRVVIMRCLSLASGLMMSGLSGQMTDASTASLIVAYTQRSNKCPAQTATTGEVTMAFAQSNKEADAL
jgi:hypothetical protein